MVRPVHAAILALVGAIALLASPATAQEFFMIFNGRVNGTDGGLSPGAGDRIIATIDGQSASVQVSPSGLFEGLTVIRSVNTPDPVTFTFRKGSTTYALVLAAQDTTPISVEYAGFNNPLAAAFSPTTVNGFIGPRVSGGGDGNGNGNGNGDGNDGDTADVDGDGVITVYDARLVLRFIVGMRQGVTDASRYDVTSDGIINTDDVIAILRREGEEAVVPAPGDDDDESQG